MEQLTPEQTQEAFNISQIQANQVRQGNIANRQNGYKQDHEQSSQDQSGMDRLNALGALLKTE